MSIELKGKEEIDRMFKIAPEAFTRSMRRWLYKERKSFVGDKKSDGVFRKMLMRKQLKGRNGTWSPNVAKSFKGYLENSNNLNMSLHMGVGFNHGNKFTQGLAKMETGFSSSPNTSKTMPIPIYKNLAAIGINNNYNKAFHRLFDSSSLEIVNVKGRVMYFDDSQGGNKGSVLFVGAGKTKVRTQFRFTKAWENRLPSALKRAEKSIEKTIRAIERQKIEAK